MTRDKGQVPLSQLAQVLGELRELADLTWRELGDRALFDHTVMFRAGTGQRVPTWAVVEAYFVVCASEICGHVVEPSTAAVVAKDGTVIDLAMLKILRKDAAKGRRHR
jgi:hypothetical protein